MILPIVAEMWAKYEKEIGEKIAKVLAITPSHEGPSYEDLLRVALDCMINEETEKPYFNSASICSLSTGSYQGTIAFMFRGTKNWGGPHHIYTTWVEYGSCSVCDALEAALEASTEEEKVRQVKTLTLHMLQHIKPLISQDEYYDLDCED